MNCLKSGNEVLNSIIFPGSLSESTYSPQSYPRNHRTIKLIYIPMFYNLTPDILSCEYIRLNVPTYIPAILILLEGDSDEIPYADVSAPLFIIHFHSNSVDASEIKSYAEKESCVYNTNYLILEFPRFGFAAGHPSEDALNHIAINVYNFVINVLHVPSNRIVLYGRSIGTGPSCFLASYIRESLRSEIAAVILHSPFTSLGDAATDILGPCINFIMFDRWKNWKYLTGDFNIHNHVITCPVLFLHADCDQIVDFEHSRILHERRLHFQLPSELYVQTSSEIFIKGHNNYKFTDDLLLPVLDFLKRNILSKFENFYIIRYEDINMWTNIPHQYQSIEEEYPNVHNNSKLTNGLKCKLCTGLCCLCTECAFACSIRWFHKLSGHHQEFTYPTKTMRGEEQLSLMQIFYKLITTGSIADVIDESDIGNEKVFRRKYPRMVETENPLFSTAPLHKPKPTTRKNVETIELSPNKTRPKNVSNINHKSDFNYGIITREDFTESPMHEL